MITFLIGQRGVGKSSLLRRWMSYGQKFGQTLRGIDLDEEIGRRQCRPIAQIFAESGEVFFRELEISVLAEVLAELNADPQNAPSVMIALGAGFKGKLPVGSEVIWVRRPTDKQGRIFLDRPALEPGMSALEEYFSRARPREEHFREVCTREITLLEGFNCENDFEPVLLGLKSAQVGGLRTVFSEDIEREKLSKGLFAQRLNWGVKAFELRDDILSDHEIEFVRGLVARDRILMSVRNPKRTVTSWAKEGLWDWPLELGMNKFDAPILSCHEREAKFSATLSRLPQQSGAHLKLAVEVETWAELREGHEWYLASPEQRSFLPRSPDGRWSWYRQLFGPHMKIAFWREGTGSAPDQPFLADWIRTYGRDKEFAAILGDPVLHSFTPAEQSAFFASAQMPVVAVRVAENEIHEDALGCLGSLGLRAAAVTAPLKEAIYQICAEKSAEAKSYKSVNTLYFYEGQWHGHNTDGEGLRTWAEQIPSGATAVWGGGGTKGVLQQNLRHAHFCSVRSRTVGTGESVDVLAPENVVWALPRRHVRAAAWPPLTWRPKRVYDLNYSEDSPGREYALKIGAEYISGLGMFRVQAQAQRQWLSQSPLFSSKM